MTGDLAGRKVLFIAYFFPPTTSTGVPGSQRTVKFLRNLSNGECHVLTVPESVRDQDNALRHLTLPVNGETIHRVAPWDAFKALLSLRKRVKGLFKRGSLPAGAHDTSTAAKPSQSTFRSSDTGQDTRSGFQKLKDFIYDACYFPDQAGPWILPATRYGKKLVRTENIDVIFATGSPWSGLITGYLISKATGKPLIVDFRDPWMDNPFHQSKGRFLDNWASKLEKKVVHHASAVSLNTPPLRDAFIERYPEIEAERFFVMPNGFDPADFPAQTTLNGEAVSDTFDLYHAGFLYGVRDPAPLLEAIRSFNKEKSHGQPDIRFIQIGDIQLSYDVKERFSDLLADGSLILEPAKPYSECLQALRSASALVNIQPHTVSQVPSKLYDYLGLDRPILNITPADGALGRMVTDENIGLLADPDDDQATRSALRRLVDAHPSNQPFDGYLARGKFSIRSISGDLASKIQQVAAS